MGAGGGLRAAHVILHEVTKKLTPSRGKGLKGQLIHFINIIVSSGVEQRAVAKTGTPKFCHEGRQAGGIRIKGKKN